MLIHCTLQWNGLYVWYILDGWNLLRAEMVAELRGNDEEEMKNGIGKDVGIYNPGYLKGF